MCYDATRGYICFSNFKVKGWTSFFEGGVKERQNQKG